MQITKVLLKSFKIAKMPQKPKNDPNTSKIIKLPKYPENLKYYQNIPENQKKRKEKENQNTP